MKLNGATKQDHAGETADPSPLGDLIQYLCAVTIAEELHFTRAARRLHLDQSAVSRHIQRLETKLGVKLFVRNGRGVEQTDAAKAFIPNARRSLDYANRGERLARAIARGDRQEFEVAYSPVVDAHLIAQIKSVVEGAGMRVPLRFQSVPADKLTQRLIQGTSHAGIGILPVANEVANLCILREKLLIALPATHRLAQRRVVHAAEIGNDSVIWVLGAHDSIATKHLIDLFHRAGYKPSISQEVQSIAEALGLVREGFGVAFVKASELRLHPEGLVIRPFSERYLVVETGLLYLNELKADLLKEFVSLVSRHLRYSVNGPPE
jgi:DNA-binding transcriptional LysR family regulator